MFDASDRVNLIKRTEVSGAKMGPFSHESLNLPYQICNLILAEAQKQHPCIIIIKLVMMKTTIKQQVKFIRAYDATMVDLIEESQSERNLTHKTFDTTSNHNNRTKKRSTKQPLKNLLYKMTNNLLLRKKDKQKEWRTHYPNEKRLLCKKFYQLLNI